MLSFNRLNCSGSFPPQQLTSFDWKTYCFFFSYLSIKEVELANITHFMKHSLAFMGFARTVVEPRMAKDYLSAATGA